MNNILIVTIGIVAVFSFLFLLILSPKKSTKFKLSSDEELDSVLKKVVSLIGGDVISFAENTKFKPKTRDEKLEELINSCGNPWNVSVYEFQVIRLTLAVAMAIVGAIIGIILITTGFAFFGIGPIIAIAIFSYLGYLYPNSYYEGIKKNRDLEFKKNFPEAIDYLLMIIGGGGDTLPVAFEVCLDYLDEGVVKEEFTKIVSDLHTGQTMESALNNFASRVPSESIKAFSKALNNANRLSVSVVDILSSRSDTSRKELELEIEKRISTLDTKVMMVLSPTAMLSIMIVALAPSVQTLLNAFNGG